MSDILLLIAFLDAISVDIDKIENDIEANTDYQTSEEVLVGSWMGSPLYRRMFIGTATSRSVEVDIGISSTKTRTLRFYQRGSNSTFGTDYYTASDDRARCFHLGNNLRFEFGSSYPSLPVEWSVILEYVK